LVALATLLAGGAAWAQDGPSKEYEVKAAFLYNFVQFVKWPPGAFASPDAPLYIGVLGDDPFEGALDDTIRDEAVNGHKLVLLRSHNVGDLHGCQMIFVARGEESDTGGILAAVDSRPILTVSDIEHFAQDGGDIDFYLSNGKVRFEINAGAARRAGLQISSQLLALGRIVGGDN
jgi:hypothetical protein